jgi:hypothetical protein
VVWTGGVVLPSFVPGSRKDGCTRVVFWLIISVNRRVRDAFLEDADAGILKKIKPKGVVNAERRDDDDGEGQVEVLVLRMSGMVGKRGCLTVNQRAARSRLRKGCKKSVARIFSWPISVLRCRMAPFHLRLEGKAKHRARCPKLKRRPNEYTLPLLRSAKVETSKSLEAILSSLGIRYSDGRIPIKRRGF